MRKRKLMMVVAGLCLLTIHHRCTTTAPTKPQRKTVATKRQKEDDFNFLPGTLMQVSYLQNQ